MTSKPSGYKPLADDAHHDSTNNAHNTQDGSHDAESGPGDRTIAPRRSKHLIAFLISASVMTTIALVTLLAILLTSSSSQARPAPSPPPPPPPGPPIKILVVGDSITHGYEGDYTWRYRLWQWLRASSSPATNVTFVGPYPGTFPPADVPPPASPQPPTPPGFETTRVWGGYALDVEPAFLEDSGRSHFSHWGRQAGQVRESVGEMVARYDADYVLVALGFNDLAWIHTVDETLDSIGVIVAGAREARPDVRFAIANVPQRTPAGGREWLPDKTDEYNGLLEGLLGELGTEESPVWLVRLREEYQCEFSWGSGSVVDQEG